MAALMPEGKQSFNNSAGAPLVGGKLYTYIAGTNTPQPTYQDAAGTVPNTNPVVLDARGEAVVFWSGVYKIVLKDSSDVTIWTVDNVSSFDSFSASTGSSKIGYIASGAGAVATDVQTVLRESVSVARFGATGIDAPAVDDSAAFLSAFATGKRVYAPAGTYRLNAINIPSGSFLFGDGESTIIKPYSDTARCALGADSGSAVAFISNIRIEDVKFLGNTAAGFLEQSHLTAFNGVKNMTIQRCYFEAFRGDGIYLGSGNTGGQERHNVNVSILDCVFDGINKENRNGISVIDGDSVEIAGNYFVNTTKTTMPAAIDIEPDAFLFHIVKNINIHHNRFNNCQGAIAVQLVEYFTTPATGVRIADNFITSVVNGIVVANSNGNAPGALLTRASVDHDITITRNQVNASTTPLFIDGTKGCLVFDNEFADCTSHAVVGVGTFARTVSLDLSVLDNRFIRCGSVSGSGLVSNVVTGLKIDGNTFTDCGTGGAGSTGVNLVPSYPSAITLSSFTGNEFYAPTAKMLNSVTETGAGTVSFNYENVYRNVDSGLPSFFVADSGTWTPSISFTTVGDLAVAYSERIGNWRRVGKYITLDYSVTTSTFTYTTAAGTLRIAGLPTPAINEHYTNPIGYFAGITKAGYTQFTMDVRNSLSEMWVFGSGSGVAVSVANTANAPSGATMALAGNASYKIQA